MQLPIYLDYASTTPADPRVVKKMQECLSLDGNFGNPASRSHAFGWKAEEATEEARQHVADLVNCDPREIVWTSGATESDNLAIKGAARFYKTKGNHIITSKIEHKAVLDSCRQLEREGFDVTYLDPDSNGIISPDLVKESLTDKTILVTLMHINNEIGADITNPKEVTIFDNVNMNDVKAGSSAPIPLNISSNVGTIKIKRARLIVIDKTKIAIGYINAPVICPLILL